MFFTVENFRRTSRMNTTWTWTKKVVMNIETFVVVMDKECSLLTDKGLFCIVSGKMGP